MSSTLFKGKSVWAWSTHSKVLLSFYILITLIQETTQLLSFFCTVLKSYARNSTLKQIFIVILNISQGLLAKHVTIDRAIKERSMEYKINLIFHRSSLRLWDSNNFQWFCPLNSLQTRACESGEYNSYNTDIHNIYSTHKKNAWQVSYFSTYLNFYKTWVYTFLHTRKTDGYTNYNSPPWHIHYTLVHLSDKCCCTACKLSFTFQSNWMILRIKPCSLSVHTTEL